MYDIIKVMNIIFEYVTSWQGLIYGCLCTAWILITPK